MNLPSRRCACGCDARRTQARGAVAALVDPVLSLVSASANAKVDLRRVAQARVGGALLACLADVWVASGLAGDLLDLRFDLVGEDGFRAGARGPAVPGVALARGFVDVRTRAVAWDASLAMKCFYRVKRLGSLVVANGD